MTARNDATEMQVRAADPGASTWLAANAGSGKTRVLTDRVARLLLDGVPPQRILCLTYTKAAASEMQNRLFKRLGEWAMKDNAALRDALTELGVETVLDDAALSDARTLFARAIETPGGLKIQTIHSFCSALLRRFPLEAGVSPQFSEMEDRAATLLQAELVEDLADGAHAGVIDRLARLNNGNDLEDLVRAVVSNREAFDPLPNWADISACFGIPPNMTPERLVADVFVDGDAEVLQQLAQACAGGGASDQKLAARLQGLGALNQAALILLEGVFLFGANTKAPFEAKIGKVPTKATQSKIPHLMPALEALMLRVQDARETRLALQAAQRTQAICDFAGVFLPEYARRKQLRGWLDFDDLILKARQLLRQPEVAAWVLYRLDGGIDHILVDEAQDTSPVQWDVIENLTQEFTSGDGARSDTQRTIFVVGDKKQSIYSFQGADPDAFDRMQGEFGKRLSAIDQALQSLTLAYSFRSADPILRLVDEVFKGQQSAGFPQDAKHAAFKTDLPGRIDLWPQIEKTTDDDDRPWHDPVDRRGARRHAVLLAERIAAQIKAMIANGETIPIDEHKRRAVKPGDFLILVQRRSDLFNEIIRACKAADLPIAGSDRLKVGAELAVKDLGALLNVLATPEDDLSLATALRSPLFGWDEQALFSLAHGRGGKFLWQALRDQAEDHPKTLAILNDLMGQADFLRPYDLIERILTRHDGRRRLLGRLGVEAEDGINALLSQALAYERNDVPSLTGFLSWMETDDLEIKRQMGSAGNLIRVMTVHGSKGLEAPIVILPDTGFRKSPSIDTLLTKGTVPMWPMAKDQMPAAMRDEADAAVEKQLNERQRLLYVALTRAEKWLIVAVAGDLQKDGNTWYQQVEAGLNQSGAAKHDFPFGAGLRLSHGNWGGLELTVETPPDVAAVSLPDHFHTPAPEVCAQPEALSPSDLGGAKALPGEDGLDEEAAKARGRHIHLLLEHLPTVPPQEWATRAMQLLPDVDDVPDLLAEAEKNLKTPDLEPLFELYGLAEVPFSADLGAHKLHGIIDRLIVTDQHVLAVDFKTNAVVPTSPQSCPVGILRQMGAYAHALAQIYPGRKIETAILWTRSAELMQLPHDLVTEALAATGYLDAGGSGS